MSAWNDAIQLQFDAAIDTLRNAIEACSEDAWRAPCGPGEVWLAVLHTVFFLDLYSGDAGEAYEPPAPFDRSQLDDDGRPPRVYTREELLGYLEHARASCRARVASLTEADAARPSSIAWLARRRMSVVECVLYNLRHVQHHAAQINLVLRRVQDHGAPWVFRGAGG